ncbi:MAG: glycosyltransferase [Chloroflexi bacterium]|nr:MAG: glycosyltransferase [Chloroflexota bacterium]
MHVTALSSDEVPAAPAVDVVVPVHNEEAGLEPAVRRLQAYLRDHFPVSARVTIVDNGSTDRTWAMAETLERELPDVRAIHLPAKGRGGALARAWLDSDAMVLAYTDVDLSTDLDALLPLVAPLLSGHSDLAIGSRLAPGARVVRGPRREVISRCYNLLLRVVLGVGFRDAQCGFKAIRADVARALLPLVENRRWFFDTELLVLAERAGMRIHEVPVDWKDDPDSRVDVVATAMEDLRGVARLSRRLLGPDPLRGLRGRLSQRAAPGLARQIATFALIGTISTAAYALLFLLLRPLAPTPVANAIALVVTAVANTVANRRFTFGVRGSGGLAGDHLGGLVAFALALVCTNLSLTFLLALRPDATRTTELVVLLAAGAVATGARFALLRALIFERRRRIGQVIEIPRRQA